MPLEEIPKVLGELADKLPRQARTWSGATPVRLFKDVRCGFHSGIPVCCIAWWVLIWRWLPFRLWRAYLFHVPWPVTHIPCPICLSRDQIVRPVRKCGC